MKRGTLMGKKPSAEPVAIPEPPSASPPDRPARPKTREGKRTVTAFLEEPAHHQLGVLALNLRTNKQELFVEALNLLFEKHGLSRIA